MCVGVPMKIIECGFGMAVCDHNGVRKEINTMLVGEPEPGAWVLVFIDAAREVIPEADAMKINDALKALDVVMSGGTDIDHLFADLTGADGLDRATPMDRVEQIEEAAADKEQEPK